MGKPEKVSPERLASTPHFWKNCCVFCLLLSVHGVREPWSQCPESVRARALPSSVDCQPQTADQFLRASPHRHLYTVLAISERDCAATMYEGPSVGQRRRQKSTHTRVEPSLRPGSDHPLQLSSMKADNLTGLVTWLKAQI